MGVILWGDIMGVILWGDITGVILWGGAKENQPLK